MSEKCDMLQSMVDRIAAGETIEAGVEEMAAIGSGLLRINAKIRQTIAVLICDAKKFFPDQSAWIAWIDENFAPNDHSDRCHLIDIGNLLTGLRNRGNCDMLQCYRAIFPLEFHKQLSLCRIARKRSLEEVPAFLSHTPGYRKMRREEFRAAVAAWLNEAPKESAEQPSLPGFDDALDTVWRLEPAELVAAVNNDDKAAQSLRAGMGLLGAALEFEKRRECPDVATLQAAKAALLSEVEEIETVIAKAL